MQENCYKILVVNDILARAAAGIVIHRTRLPVFEASLLQNRWSRSPLQFLLSAVLDMLPVKMVVDGRNACARVPGDADCQTAVREGDRPLARHWRDDCYFQTVNPRELLAWLCGAACRHATNASAYRRCSRVR